MLYTVRRKEDHFFHSKTRSRFAPLHRIFVYVVLLTIHLVSPVFPQNGDSDAREQIVTLEGRLREESENTEILLKLGILYHNLGVKGDKKAVKRAENLFEKLSKLETGLKQL